MDPCIVYLENRLTGISLYKMPIAGPLPSGEVSRPSVEEKFTVKGYADDLKVALKTMAEFLLLNMKLETSEPVRYPSKLSSDIRSSGYAGSNHYGHFYSNT